MAKDINKIAKSLGATVVSEIPNAGGGAFGAARMVHIFQALQSRLEPGDGMRKGRPTDSSWVHHPKVPMSEATERKLAELAERASTPERRVSPMQMAAQLLEQAVAELSDG
jgi:hypothetical protein